MQMARSSDRAICIGRLGGFCYRPVEHWPLFLNQLQLPLVNRNLQETLARKDSQMQVFRLWTPEVVCHEIEAGRACNLFSSGAEIFVLRDVQMSPVLKNFNQP